MPDINETVNCNKNPEKRPTANGRLSLLKCSGNWVEKGAGDERRVLVKGILIPSTVKSLEKNTQLKICIDCPARQPASGT